MNADINLIKKFNEIKAATERSGRIKECFHYDQSECKGGIIKAHAITENGRLSLLETEVSGGQKKIYSFDSFTIGSTNYHGTLKPAGRASESTFYGFCKYHDQNLFSKIEQNEFDESDEHLFLHSYRSFAFTYHTEYELFKTYSDENNIMRKISPSVFEEFMYKQHMFMYDLNNRKTEFNNYLRNKHYEGLRYLFYEKEGLYPFACSFMINPPVLYNNELVNRNLVIGSILSHVITTFLPGEKSTIAILATFPNDKKANQLLDQLEVLSDRDLEKAISSMIIGNQDSFYFSPAWWNMLSPKNQRAFLDEHEKHIKYDGFSSVNKFFISKFNFFDERYEGRKLGLLK